MRDYLPLIEGLTIYVAIYPAGAESENNSQSTANDNKERKRERERARYAAMSQSEKNARNLRQREARQKTKGAGELHICCLPWVDQHSICCYHLVASFNTPICFVLRLMYFYFCLLDML